MRTVRVVLLNWNDREQADRCLAAVLDSEGVRPDVLVVDNGSEADDAGFFRDRLGDDRVLALPENTGYAGGMNAGLEFWRAEAGDDPVLLVTPDARVQPDTLAALADELDRDPTVGLVGPVVVHSRVGDGWVTAGGRVRTGLVRSEPLRHVQADRPYDADWIDGCCMLIRRELLDELGGIDDRFFIYFEEVDLCRRAREAGWKVRVLPGVEIDHPKSLGSLAPYYFYYMVRNRYLFFRKGHGIRAPRVALGVLGSTLHSWASVAKALLVPGRRRELRLRLRDARLQLRGAVLGTLDHLRGRYGRMPAGRMGR